MSAQHKYSARIYEGRVVHTRFRPKHHRLQYRVFSLLVDLDELDRFASARRLLSVNRFNLFSLWTRDHGNGSPTPLRAQVADLLRQAGLENAAARIQLLCYPRILGYVFNPLSVFYCRNADGALQAIVYEVHNTFGERHAYVLPVDRQSDGIVRQSCDKAFYVSPYMPMTSTYRFTITDPGEKLRVSISQSDPDGPLLDAMFDGNACPVTDAKLLALFFRYPLMTLKITCAIHWEALRLLMKRIPVFRHVAATGSGVSLPAKTQEMN